MSNPQEFVIKGVKLSCNHCGANGFTSRRAQLNTAIMTAFDLDYLNASADVYVCSDCGHLHWFIENPLNGSFDASDTSDASICLECGTRIPPNKESCGACGWSYK